MVRGYFFVNHILAYVGYIVGLLLFFLFMVFPVLIIKSSMDIDKIHSIFPSLLIWKSNVHPDLVKANLFDKILKSCII